MAELTVRIRDGSTVHLHYELCVEGGVALEASNQPTTFIHGAAAPCRPIQAALLGKGAGDIVQVLLDPRDAFGEWSQDLVVQLPRGQFRAAEPLAVGMRVDAQTVKKQQVIGTVTAMTTAKVTVDLNHPFADVPVTAHIRVVRVEAPAKTPRAK